MMPTLQTGRSLHSVQTDRKFARVGESSSSRQGQRVGVSTTVAEQCLLPTAAETSSVLSSAAFWCLFQGR